MNISLRVRKICAAPDVVIATSIEIVHKWGDA
jgi:hypothetical protein